MTFFTLLLATVLPAIPLSPMKVAVAPTDSFAFAMPAQAERAADKALLAGVREVCVDPLSGAARRRPGTCDRPIAGVGANTSLDVCYSDSGETLVEPKVTCEGGDASPTVIDMTSVGCKTDACFVEAATNAGATHLLRLAGGFRDRHTTEQTLSVTALLTRLSDGRVRVVRPEDIDPGFNSAQFRPQYEALGVIRWLARSAVAAEIAHSLSEKVSPPPLSPAPPIQEHLVPPIPPVAPAVAEKPSVVAPSIVAAVGASLLATGIILWTSDGPQDCVGRCATDRRSARAGIPLTIAGGAALLGGGFWLWSRLSLSVSSNNVALIGRF